MDSHWMNGKMSSNGESAEYRPPEPQKPSLLQQTEQGVSQSFQKLRSLLKAMRDPLPTQTGDGSILPQARKESLWKDVENLFRDIQRQDAKDLEGLLKTFQHAALKEPVDDKDYLMESMVAVASKMPDAKLQKKITNTFITTLWDDLEHPPQTLLSDEFHFRLPDGSNNSYKYPDLGKSGMPYARTVVPKSKQLSCLPDPGVLFDSVLARKGSKGEPHPNRISSILFYLASIIIHDIFRTDHVNVNQSNSSSYLDLAPLYGNDWSEQKLMRTFKDGKIKPDCFSESRLLMFPPGVGAILIMFNRFHNYVVEQIAAINEGGRFSVDPRHPTVDRYGEKGLDKRDDDLFQTARLITCGLYINIILIDYVRTILNLNRTDDNWQLNPRVSIPDGPPLGTGNQVSAEFNLVYRWHSAISPRDDWWTQELFKEKFPSLDAAEAGAPGAIHTFLSQLKAVADETQSKEPYQRDFPALKRQTLERIKDGPHAGSFRDEDLAKLLTDGIEDCANAMGPQQVPKVMKAVEILGIQQARAWKLSTLNEFRQHFDLVPHATFEDITSNREVQEALKHLYDTPDQVELYPGLVVEDAKEPKLPGSGLCPSYTVSRAVLSDAVALVRGDRFYTASYTPALLTNWGFEEAASDLTIDNGCVFYKLFLRALPSSFDPASVWVHYPLTCPDEMETILRDLEKAHLYNFDAPHHTIPRTVVFSRDAALQICEDQVTFKMTYSPAMEFLLGPKARSFMLARPSMEKALYLGSDCRTTPIGNEKWYKAIRSFYERKTTELLREKAYKLAGVNYVDIIRDVGNIAHVHFGAELFSIPLKTKDFPHGVFTEKQLYLIMVAVFSSISSDLDPSKSFPLRLQAKEACRQLDSIMKLQVRSIKMFGKTAETLINTIKPHDGSLSEYGTHMIARLCKTESDIDDVVVNIIGSAAGLVAKQGQLLGQALDYFFTDGQAYLSDINYWAKQDTPEGDDKLMHYLMEGVRLNGETIISREVENDVTVIDTTEPLGTRIHNLKEGDCITVNLKAASRDPKHFPEPDKVVLDRPLDQYLIFGAGMHQCLGLPMARVALTTMLKVIGRLDNLRPATVAYGTRSGPHRVKKVLQKGLVSDDASKVPEEWQYHVYLTEDWDKYFPFPCSLKINWDGAIPDSGT